MPPSTPFVDRETGAVDTTQILVEAIPLFKLVGTVVAIALVPFTIAYLLRGSLVIRVGFTVAGQVILAVGTGIVLMYVISRAMELSGER